MKFTFEQHNALIRAAAERYQERFAVNPGDFATVRQDSEEAIRARLNEWSIRLPWADIQGVSL